MRRDLVCAALALALAGAYYVAADALPTSLLADGVGAGGIPKLLAVALGVLCVLLGARSLVAGAAAASTVAGIGDHLRALGVAGLGLAYVAAAPHLGYPLAVALLLAATTLYYGASLRLTVLVYALGCAAVLWLVFARMLGVAMPAGVWARLLGG
ncbi:MAG TPA: tripartite tricarboxylate transporter TctB family protein [Burkholderiales bacterium]|nr:tripartite tricarboxylate transporter TctB family protein [Burkholderiales bacterium]